VSCGRRVGGLREGEAPYEIVEAYLWGVGMSPPSVIAMEGSCRRACGLRSVKVHGVYLVHKRGVCHLIDSAPPQTWYIADLSVRVRGGARNAVGQAEEQEQKQKCDGAEVVRAAQEAPDCLAQT
jgi:hypothetical protein